MAIELRKQAPLEKAKVVVAVVVWSVTLVALVRELNRRWFTIGSNDLTQAGSSALGYMITITITAAARADRARAREKEPATETDSNSSGKTCSDNCARSIGNSSLFLFLFLYLARCQANCCCAVDIVLAYAIK